QREIKEKYTAGGRNEGSGLQHLGSGRQRESNDPLYAPTVFLKDSMAISSFGRRNSTSSSITVKSWTSAVPNVLRYATTSSTRTSGADAPAVIPTACTSVSQVGLMSDAASIK